MSNYRTESRDGVEAVIADDDRVVGIVYANDAAEATFWIGRSTNQSVQYDSRKAALDAVVAHAEEHPGYEMP